MANNKLLGCWGFIVGLFVAAFLGWMGFEILVHFFAALSTQGLGAALTNSFFLHKLGELIIVTTLIMATYVGVFRGRAGIGRFAAAARVPLWLAAALNLAAWVQMLSGSRFSTWSLVLVVVGIVSPLILRSLRAR